MCNLESKIVKNRNDEYEVKIAEDQESLTLCEADMNIKDDKILICFPDDYKPQVFKLNIIRKEENGEYVGEVDDKGNMQDYFSNKYVLLNYIDRKTSIRLEVSIDGKDYNNFTNSHVELGRYKWDFEVPMQIFNDNNESYTVSRIDHESEEFKSFCEMIKENMPSLI